MTEIEDFIIQEPYKPTKEERLAIRELEEKVSGLVPEDWDSKKTYIKSFKENLRKDMYKKQNELCAFCRIHTSPACVPMHREHIVYKKEGVSKCPHPLFLCTKPRLSQARALLFPKVFVPLGIQKFSL